MKRFLAIFVISALVVSSLCVTASAYGGYAHWEIATRVVTIENISASNNYATAYKSGCLLADIGRVSWDKKYGVDSDSQTFARKMMSISAPNMQGTYFARGWQSHVYQDAAKDLDAIVGSDGYFAYGRVDEYLRDKMDISCPINGTANMYVVYDMIRTAYYQLTGFSPTNAQIDDEIETMFFMYNSLIAMNVLGMNATQIAEMNSQFDEIAENCYSTSSLYSLNSGGEPTNISSLYDYALNEREKESKKAQSFSLESQAKNYAHIDIVCVDEYGGAEVRFVIEDYDAYAELVELNAKLLFDNTKFEVS